MNKQRWLQEEISFLKQNYPNITVSFKDLENTLRRKRSVIIQKANSLGLYRIRKEWTESEVQYLTLNYPNNDISLEDIKNYLRRPLSNIMRKASYLKLTRQITHSIDNTYFDNLDSWEKCYVLGLLSADGCNDTRKGRVYIQLQEQDKHLLESIKQNMKYTGPLCYKKEVNELGKFKSKPSWVFRFCNNKLSETLEELGVISNKSLTLKFCTKVPEHFLSAYILGLWDGDGCICNTGKYPVFSFAGTEDVVSKMSTILSTVVGKQINYHHKKNTKYFVFSISGYNNVKLIREYLYKDSTICLTRKQNKMFSF